MTSDTKKFLSSGPIVAFEWNLKKSYFDFVSESVFHNFGYKVNEVIKNRLFLYELFSKKDLYRILSEIKTKFNENTESFEISSVRIKQADGSISWNKIFFNLEGDNNEDKYSLFGYILDITAEVETNKKLKENKEIYKIITESSTDVIFMINRSGIVTYINNTVESLQGIKQSDIINKSFKKFVPEKEVPRFLSKITKIYLGKEVRNFKTLVYDKDLNAFPVEINGKLVDYNGKQIALGIIRDIRKQTKFEDELKKFSSAVEFSVNGILITDSEGKIEYLNRKYSEISGYEYRDLIGKKFSIFKKDNNSISNDIEEQIKRRGEWHGEFNRRKKDGKLYWEHIAISPIFSKNKETINYVVISEDISDRINAEKELIISKEKAEESDRLKTAFLANISHEIRTPLNAIMGFASFLKDPDHDSDKRNKYAEIIYDSGSHLLELINNIVDLSKIEAGQADFFISKIDIEELFEEIYSMFKPNIKNDDVKFNYEVLNGIDKKDFFSDKVKLKQVLINLISNALKFTKQGHVKYTCQYFPEKILFIVEDTGIGIPKAFKNEIFDRFKQVNKISQKYGGTGLGLSIVKETVKLLKGNIRLNSKLDEGTTFYFEFSYN